MISVIIPARNAEASIGPAIQSVLAQVVNDIEVLCIVNGTTDNTVDSINQIKDNRIKILYSEPGIVPALNMGLKNSQGEFIARQDADDIWLPEKLNKQLKFFDDNKDIDILGTQINIVDSNNSFIRKTAYPTEHSEIVKGILSGINPIAHPSVFFKRKILDKCAGYFDLFPLAEDLDLWSRCLPWFKFSNLDEALVTYKHVPNPNYNPKVPVILSSWYRSIYGV